MLSAGLVPMTLPRPVVPGRCDMITRRCIRRTCLLRPDPALVQFYLYSLAVFSNKYGIEVHSMVLMSTHEHLIVTDTQGRMPDFLRDFHRTVAHGVQILRKWEGTVWDNEHTSRVELCTPRAIIEKFAYAMANPVEAGLAEKAEQWPGVLVLPEELGNKTWTIERPDVFFDADNSDWPQTATLRLSMPKTHLLHDDVRRRVRVELNQLETDAQDYIRVRPLRVLGRIDVLEESPYRRAKSWEPLRRLNPNFAVGRGQRSALFQAVQVLRTFRTRYREALAQWRNGIRDVLFPKHTWQMSWLHAVQVETT